MKVYFVASRNQKQNYENVYIRMVDYLSSKGCEVYTPLLSEYEPDTSDITNYSSEKWYKRWQLYIKRCDFAVIEGSYPSTIHIGFEVGMLLARRKPVILLYHEGADPVFINKLHSNKLIKSEYDNENLEEVLDWCVNEV